MKNKSFLIVVFTLIFIFSAALPAQETPKQTETPDVDYRAGLVLGYNRADVKLGDAELESTLEYTYLGIQIDVDLMDFLTVGVIVGYNSNSFKDPVDFNMLPLSLRVDGERFNSMMFGARARAEVYSWKDFSLTAEGELSFYKRFKTEFPIQLSIASGNAVIRNTFTQISLDLLVQYDGFTNFTVYGGPQLNLISGNIIAEETIDAVNGEEKLSYSQKNLLGLTAGIFYELGDHFDVYAKISMLSKMSLTVSFMYVF